MTPAATVAAVLERLCGQDGVSPREVVVLSSHGREKSAVFAAGAGRLRYTDRRGGGRDAVYFSSIRGFKGLESPVVVLCELEDLDEATRDQQLYVGISRARNHCIVLAPGPAVTSGLASGRPSAMRLPRHVRQTLLPSRGHT